MSDFVLSKDLDWVRFGRRIAVLYPIAHALGLMGSLMQAQPKSALIAWIIVDIILLVGVVMRRRLVAPIILAHAVAFPMLSGEVGRIFIWNLFLTPSSTIIFATIGAWGIWSEPRGGTELPPAVSNCLLSALVFVVIAVQGVHHSWAEQGMRGAEFLAAVFVSLVILTMALWMARGSRIAAVVGWVLLAAGMIFAAQDGGWIDWMWLLMSSTIWCLAYLAFVSVWGAFSMARLPVDHHPRPFRSGISRYAGRGLATALLVVLALRFAVEAPPAMEQMAGVDLDGIDNERSLADEGEMEGFTEAFGGGVASVDKKEKPKSKLDLRSRKTSNVPELGKVERAGVGIR